jgi:hypothetical protein
MSQLRSNLEASRTLIETILRLFTAGTTRLLSGPHCTDPSSALQGLRRQETESTRVARDSSSQDGFTEAEIYWFLNNCYNIAIEYAYTWPSSVIVRLFEVAIEVWHETTSLLGDINAQSCLDSGSATTI